LPECEAASSPCFQLTAYVAPMTRGSRRGAAFASVAARIAPCGKAASGTAPE
jgi:hypothetical protein